MKVKAIIFDLFGVLSELFNQRWIRENVSDKPEIVKELLAVMKGLDIGRNTQVDFWSVAAQSVGRTPKLIQQEMESSFHIYPDMFKLADELRNKYKTAIFSNAFAPYTRELFRKKGIILEDHFDKIYISSEIMLVKPDAEAFKYVASELGVKANECLFVDDNQGNILGAEKVGMKGHLFTSQKLFKDWLNSI